MSDPFDLEDRIVVVTGARGRLGRRFVQALVDRRARVVALDVAAGDAVPGALEVRADVTDRSSLEAALARVVSEWGPPTGLVNNAGIDAPPDAPAEENGPFETYPESSWDRVMSVNAKGPLLCAQVFGGAMARASGGSIVNIGSIYGIVSPDQRFYEHRRRAGAQFFKPIAYSASKAALVGMTKYLSTYFAPGRVRVNALTFGGVFAGQDAAFVDAYTARVPLGRMAREEDTVGPLLFLLSDAAAYVTGTNLVVDGGFTAW